MDKLGRIEAMIEDRRISFQLVQKTFGEALEEIKVKPKKKKKRTKDLTASQIDKRFCQRVMNCAHLKNENPKTERIKCILGCTGVKFRRFDRHFISKKPIMAQLTISFEELRTNNNDTCIQAYIDTVIFDFETFWNEEDKRIEKANLPKKKIVQKEKSNGKAKKHS